MKLLSKRESRVKESTYKQAEDDISNKTINSSKQPKRSNSRGSNVDTDSLVRRARSGDSDAMRKLLDYI